MLKIVFHTLIILLVTGLVAGGIYMFVENRGSSLIGTSAQATNFNHGNIQASFAQPANAVFNQGQFHPDGDSNGQSFSLADLSGVVIQLGKVAAIAALVTAVKALMRIFKRQRRSAAAAN